MIHVQFLAVVLCFFLISLANQMNYPGLVAMGVCFLIVNLLGIAVKLRNG